MNIKHSLGAFLLTLSWSAAEIKPTEVRNWTSKSGNRITGKATEMTPNKSIQIITNDERELTIGIDQFSQADQDFLITHFEEAAPPQVQTAGSHQGPLKADADTSYYLYTPKDFDAEASAPVMIWTQSDGAQRETLHRFSEAADVLGMIIATPVEATFEGEVTLINNLSHTRDVLKSLNGDFSVSCKGIHFGGDKSGGAAAFNNSLQICSAGTFTVSGFLTPDMTGSNTGHHFMASSTNSSYRYMTAYSAAKFGEDATHYFYAGAREMPESRDVAIGMIWMYAQGLYENRSCRGAETKNFQERILPWLKDLAATSPGDAAYLTQMLTTECKLSGRFEKEIKFLHAKLARIPEAVAHVQGAEALDDFSERVLARYGSHHTPLTEHDPKKFDRMLKKLAKTYQSAEDLQPIFTKLAEPTHR